MIKYIKGDIFKSQCEALVNPVNCKGVMGKGLALEFKKRFPENFKYYKSVCDNPNNLFLVGGAIAHKEHGKLVINAATKSHWRDKSELEHIKTCLAFIGGHLVENDIKSVAIPALGCGLGELEWKEVKKEIDDFFKDSGTYVEVFEPH